MANDPAFLFYPKDWIQGTAQMSAEEKGVYIDLLAHQQQENGLPTDTKRLARLVHFSHDDFLKVWEFLSKKFKEYDGKLYNAKLQRVIKGRSEYSDMRRIVGTFGKLLKDKQVEESLKTELKKSFDWRVYAANSEQNVSKTISSWIDEVVATCSSTTTPNDGNGIENGNAIIYNNSIPLNNTNRGGKLFFDLSKEEKENTIEYIHRVVQREFSLEEIESKFKAFKIQHENDFYSDRNKLIKHFRDWLKNPKNGHDTKHTKAGSLSYDKP